VLSFTTALQQKKKPRYPSDTRLADLDAMAKRKESLPPAGKRALVIQLIA
jgi:hypothetical protein